MKSYQTCPSCHMTYEVEWHDLSYTEIDAENDAIDPVDPEYCPFCGGENVGEDFDEDDDF